MNQEEAIRRIAQSRGALCVMPSLIENSPCVVGECFTIGAPFLTTNVGGTPELIDPESRPHCLVEPNSKALATVIERVFREGLPAVKSNLVPQSISQNWADCLKVADASVVSSEIPTAPASKPLVSVCMTHYERPQLLQQALDQLMAQTYDNIEIIVVDDGSRRPDAHEFLDELERRRHRFPVKIIRSANLYLGAARNIGASHAAGEYILFHDDDNFAEPNEIEVFVRAALRSGCEILTSQYWVFKSGEEQENLKPKMVEYYPIGVGGTFSFFRNRFGDANALIKREVFEKLGGFTELHGVGWEDWELFLRAYLRGIKMGVVPDPLFNYRVSAQGMLATSEVVRNHERLFAMVDQERPQVNSDLLRYTQRHSIQQKALEQLWAILDREPTGEIHQQLTSIDPNSSEARVKLSDLAFAMGRLSDAIEIGFADFAQREKMLGLLSHLSGSASPRREKLIVIPDTREGAPVALLRGWAFGLGGRPFVPTEFQINRQPFQTIAHVAQTRLDVVDRFKLARKDPVGFVVAVAKSARRRNLAALFGASRRAATFIEGDVTLLGPRETPLKAHIDEVFWGREVVVETPPMDRWGGVVTIMCNDLSYVFIKNGSGKYIASDKISDKKAKFYFAIDEKLGEKLSFIIAGRGRTDISFD